MCFFCAPNERCYKFLESDQVKGLYISCKMKIYEEKDTRMLQIMAKWIMAHEIAGAVRNVRWSINEDRMILRYNNDVWIEEIH